jgi:hypothetical protein
VFECKLNETTAAPLELATLYGPVVEDLIGEAPKLIPVFKTLRGGKVNLPIVNSIPDALASDSCLLHFVGL